MLLTLLTSTVCSRQTSSYNEARGRDMTSEGNGIREGETIKDEQASTSYGAFDGVHQQQPESPSLDNRQVRNNKGLFWGLQASPELCAVALGYFVQGVKTRMAIMAEKYLMKDILLLSPAKTEVWLEIAHSPWIVKPIFGFISDSFPILGERRRPYLVICGISGAVAYVLLGSLSNGPWMAVVFMTIAETSIAFSDVAIDGIIVERSRDEPQATAGSLQSVCWGSQAIGSLISAWSGGWLVEKAGPRITILVMAIFPLLICCTALLIKREVPEKKTTRSASLEAEEEAQKLVLSESGKGDTDQTSARSQLSTLLATLISRPILLPTVFMLTWGSTPLFSTAMFFFYTNALHFTAEFVGRIELLDGLAQLGGVVLFNMYLKAVPLRKVFLWVCIASTLAGLTQMLLVTGLNRSLGLSDKLFVAFDSVLVEALTRVALMPVLVLAARICPQNVEATLYATLMAVQNGASSIGSLSGALLTSLLGVTATSFAGMPWLVLICTALRLLPLAFLWLLPPAAEQRLP